MRQKFLSLQSSRRWQFNSVALQLSLVLTVWTMEIYTDTSCELLFSAETRLIIDFAVI